MSAKKLALLLNLGSPRSPQLTDVQHYLKQFLMDPDVITLPKWLRYLLVYGGIVPLRARQSSCAYRTIWTDSGAPLLIHSHQLVQHLSRQSILPIYLAMRYGPPAIAHTLQCMHREHPSAHEVILLPLYPHHADSTVSSAIKEVNRALKIQKLFSKITIIPPFYNHKEYIHALVASAKPWLEQPYDHLLFSYHGLPQSHLKKADRTGKHCLTPHCCSTPSSAHRTCYYFQVQCTTQAFVDRANISKHRYSIAFQSRLGRAKWLSPYTDRVLSQLGQQGIQHLLVISPAFTSDCVETLEELGIRGRNIFQTAGGKKLTLIPCLNHHPVWVTTLTRWLNNFAS